MAEKTNYDYSFFKPGKAIRLQEEMTFLYECLAIQAAYGAVAGSADFDAVVESFLFNMRKRLFGRLIKRKKFQARYSHRLEAYFVLLREDSETMEVAKRFLEVLFQDSQAALNLESSIRVAGMVAASQLALNQLLRQLTIAGAGESSNNNPPSPELGWWAKAVAAESSSEII